MKVLMFAELFRYKKLALNPRPQKFFCGYSVVLNKAERRERGGG